MENRNSNPTAAGAAVAIPPSQDESKAQQEIEVEMTLVDGAEKGKDNKNDTWMREAFFSGKQSMGDFGRRIDECYKPILCLMMLTGRFPLTKIKTTKSSDTSSSTCDYEPSLFKFNGIYFIFVSFLSLYTLLVGTFNLMDIMLNLTGSGDCDSSRNNGNSTPTTEEQQLPSSTFELALFDRNIVPFAIIWSALCQFSLESVNILRKRRYFAKYLFVWKAAADTMKIDVAAGVHRHTIILLIIYFLTCTTLTVMAALQLSAILVGSPALTSILMFRLSFPCLLQRTEDGKFGSNFLILRIFGGVCLIFVFLGSQILILLFILTCKMLKNAFRVWNGRFKKAIIRDNKINFEQSVSGRTTYELLFKDHCILLDLIEGTDRFFSTTIESYLSLQVVGVIFEIYFVIRTTKYGSKQSASPVDSYFIRPHDWIPGLIILIVNTLVLVVVLRAAAQVGREAMEGLEIIRTRTMLGRKTDEELYFMLSMFTSYTANKNLCLKGGGYFNLNREFMITVLSIIMTYFIIMYQFEPTLDYDFSSDNFTNVTTEQTFLHKRKQIGIFLRDLEGLEDDHWVV